MSFRSLNTLFFQLNHGDPAPLKPLGINHVHRPTHAPPAAASVNQGVASSAEGYGWVVDGGEVFCAMLQAASAKAAKSTVTSQGGASQRSPSLPLQCRQCRSRGRDWVPDMQVYGFLRQGLVNRSMITRGLNFGAFQLFIRESSGQSISYVCSCMCLLYI